ncbi:MAG: hypothetical protein ABW178_13355 [Pseudoxanthomonas sp.]
MVLHDPTTTTSWRRDPVTGAAVAVVLRQDQPPANTCIALDGAPSVLLLLPLPATRDALATLFWHEQWHCIQGVLGLSPSEGNTAHLDSEAGRTWLRLEMRALARALSAVDDRQARQHVGAALDFRALRSASAAPGSHALTEEAKLERNEGLAEYTGRTVAAAGGDGDPVPAVVEALAAADTAESFVRSAAYATGPAYGLLLDRWSPQWRLGLSTDSDLPTLLAEQRGQAREATGVEHIGRTYGIKEVRAEERERAKVRAQRSADLRRRFLGSDAIRLPLQRPSVSFDPRTLFPLDQAGTVYTPITVRDAWGELTAAAGALLSQDWSLLSVQGGTVEGCAARWKGPGWTLELSEGWRLDRHGGGWRLTQGTSAPAHMRDACPE